MDTLVDLLLDRAKDIIPSGNETNVNERQAAHLIEAHDSLTQIGEQTDFLIIAEQLRVGRGALDALTGKASTEHMLDTLFGNFCIGK